MFSVKQIGVGLFCVVVGGSAAQAQDLQMVEKIGDRTLYYSEALGDNCLASRTDAEGRQFQVGVDRKKELAYAGLFANADAGMTAGAVAPVSLELGGKVFAGDATQYGKGGVEGGYVYFNNMDFAYELGKQQTMTVNVATGNKISVDLTGSSDAIVAVIDCQIATMT